MSRTRWPITSRSNWAKDKSTLREQSHARRGVEGLRHRDEGDLMVVERLDQLGEVGERTRQAIAREQTCGRHAKNHNVAALSPLSST